MKTQATTLDPFVPSGPHFARSIEFFVALGFEKEWEDGGYAGLRFGRRLLACPAERRLSAWSRHGDGDRMHPQPLIAVNDVEASSRSCRPHPQGELSLLVPLGAPHYAAVPPDRVLQASTLRKA
jgi:hypothetical protein